MKNILKKGAFVSILALLFSGIISCEKDFTDLNSSIISNDQFITKDTILEVVVTNVPIESVRGDGLEFGGVLGQYLLGVYNNPNYEKIEASVITQLAASPDFKVVEDVLITDTTTVITALDTVFLRIPYQATLIEDTVMDYTLDSIIGNKEVPFYLNVYQLDTYLNTLNPLDPTQGNEYSSDYPYTWLPEELNSELNYPFIPNKNDTVFYLNRKLSTGVSYIDTLRLSGNRPFARIPLKKTKIKELLMDKYDSEEFDSQEAFDTYFRGLYLQAQGNDGSLISLAFTEATIPSIEIYYTNTVILNSTGEVLDTIEKNDSFYFTGVRNNAFKMNQRVYPVDNTVKIQGTSGSMANVKIFGTDANGNNLPDQIEDLRPKNWLINDASLIFYVDQSVPGTDTLITPYKLFLFKNGEDNGVPNQSQIKDLLSEGPDVFGGNLEVVDGKPEKYTFRITDYVSELLSGDTDYIPTLGLKVYNALDLPTSLIDTIIENYSWNPKVVTLLNHDKLVNGERRALLKISYTEKKNE